MLRNQFNMCVMVIAALTASLSATAAPPTGPANADIVFRLDATATYQTGCFDPCDCPLQQPQPIYGVFVMGPANIGDVVDFHEITDIRWKIPFADPPIEITGSGTYRITNFGEPQMHALDLELSINGGPTQFFFSDFVPVTSNDGSIEIPISMNGVFCLDTVINVNASPVPANEILNYQLIEGSAFQQGCFDPCDCPLEAPRKMRGQFRLVPAINFGTYVEYAVIQLKFTVPAANANNEDLSITGGGWYILIQGFAGPIQSAELDLSLNGAPPVKFDSPYENIDAIFPTIHIQVDMNDMVCFDQVLTIHAKPVNLAALSNRGVSFGVH